MNQEAETARTLGQSTFERLRNMILDGTLPSGTRLQEKSFADRLGVSRTPVREAIGQLVSAGLVTRSGGGMPMVSSISLTEIMEILHVRRLLECEAARQVALSNKGIEELTRLRARVSGFLTEGRPDAETHTQFDDDLHVTIARLAGSQLLLEMIENLKMKTRIFDQGSIPARFEPGCHEHLRIIDAIVAGDSDAASEAMRLHLTHAREAIIHHIHRPF